MTIIEAPYLRSTDLFPDAEVAFAQTIKLGGGAAGAKGMTFPAPVVHGAFVRVGTDPPLPLAVSLHYRHDPTASVTPVTTGKDLRWLDSLNEAGAGSLVLANDDPLLGTISGDSFVLFEVHGWAAFTMIARELNVVMINPAEEVAQLTTVSGPGTLAILEEALVYPSRGVGAWPIEDDRVFSWPAPDYNDWWWGKAKSFGSVYDATPAWYGIIPFWPPGVPADIIGPPQGADLWAPGGVYYVRGTVTIDRTGPVNIYVAGDDLVTAYFDGQEIISTDQWGNVESDVKVEQIDASAGEHTIALQVTNLGDDQHRDNPDEINPTMVVVGVATMAADGSVAQAHGASGAGWQMLAYPPEPPGMTPGEAMEHCLLEAHTRGVLNEVTWTFTGAVDSAGVPWPVVGDIATKVGYDLLTFFRELTNTYVDIAMSPAGTELYAWVSGGRGETTDIALHGPTDPNDPTTGNLTQLTYRRAMVGASQLLVRWAGGWNNVPNFPQGHREACLGLGAQQSLEEVQRIGQAQLDDLRNERSEIAAEMTPMGMDDMPVLTFGVADFITVPDNAGPQSQRVLALGAALDDDGALTWSLELKDRLLDQRERTEQALKKMDNGTLRGSSKVATPTGDVGKRNIPPKDTSSPG